MAVKTAGLQLNGTLDVEGLNNANVQKSVANEYITLIQLNAPSTGYFTGLTVDGKTLVSAGGTVTNNYTFWVSADGSTIDTTNPNNTSWVEWWLHYNGTDPIANQAYPEGGDDIVLTNVPNLRRL